jgi:HEPN domain-containing protein
MERYETWLDRARSSLEYAKAKVSHLVYYEEQCYQAQQAAEKALKGLLIYYQVEPEFTHNIERLFNALSEYAEIPDNVKGATKLTDYATFTRYPGEYDDITKEEYKESIVLATNCLEWAEQKIKGSDKTGSA